MTINGSLLMKMVVVGKKVIKEVVEVECLTLLMTKLLKR